MSLQKTTTKDKPHAVYSNANGWIYLVLKTYQKPEKEGELARWLVAVQSPYTFGSYEVGDTYVRDLKRVGARLVGATDEWVEAYGLPQRPLTPRQWFFANDVDPTR